MSSPSLSHSQRSLGEIHNFHCQGSHCINGITLNTIYKRVAQTDSPKHPLSILLPYGQRCCFAFLKILHLLTRENSNCMTAHARAHPVWVSRRKTTFPRHLIVAKCTVKLSTGSACLWCTERRQQHSKSDPKHNKPSSS